MIPYSRHYVSKSDIKSVVSVLKSDFLTQGPIVKKFEKKICKLVKSRYSVASNSATSSLHIACLALGLKKGDYLWTSTNTFVASANCGKYCGAHVKFLDIDPDTYNLSYNDLLSELKKAQKLKRLPKILVVVHLAGLSVNMKKIKILSKKYKFKIIEDASHALGSTSNKHPVGSCKFSDITIFSFHPVKIITTGEGGIATTNSKLLKKKMMLFREHGIERSHFIYNKNKKSKWYYEQQKLGYNYRMSDINAALGLSQLYRLKSIIKKRNQIAEIYFKLLKGLPIKLPIKPNSDICSFHLFIIQIDPNKTKVQRDQLFNFLRKRNIYTNLHYAPVHMQPFYFKKKSRVLPNSLFYSKNAMSIPVFERLSFKDQKKIVHIIKQGLQIEKNI